jgi:hypothetical protein
MPLLKPDLHVRNYARSRGILPLASASAAITSTAKAPTSVWNRPRLPGHFNMRIVVESIVDSIKGNHRDVFLGMLADVG